MADHQQNNAAQLEARPVDMPMSAQPVAAEAAIPPKRPRNLRRTVRRAWRIFMNVGVRMYALAVFLLVLWPAYIAVTYLYRTVFVPTPVPAELLEWQAHVDTGALRARDVPGVTGPAARAPLSHYHRVERWFQPDPLNGCTSEGCHDPLPHSQKNKVPTFANFHTTFLACQMCHSPSGDHSAPVGWVSTADAGRQDPPALLRLLRFLETKQELIRTNPREAHKTIMELLRGTVAIVGNDLVLNDLLLQFETSDPGSPMWRRAVERAINELPYHARGEYGAKLARDANGSYRTASAALLSLAKRYFQKPAERKDVQHLIHDALLKEPLACGACHGDTPPTLDFEALGYSPKRAKLLSNLQLANLMQQIREGKQFHIFKLMGGQNGN